MENLRRHVVHNRRDRRFMMSNPPQGNNGKIRGHPRGRGASRGKGGQRRRISPPRGRRGPKAPHSRQKNHPRRKNHAERGPSRAKSVQGPPPPEKCYESKASWEECIEKHLIPKGSRLPHPSRINAERQDEERGSNDYQGPEIDTPTRTPRRHKVERGPLPSQSKSLYISRALRYL